MKKIVSRSLLTLRLSDSCATYDPGRLPPCPSPGEAAAEQAGEVAEDGKHVELISVDRGNESLLSRD